MNDERNDGKGDVREDPNAEDKADAASRISTMVHLRTVVAALCAIAVVAAGVAGWTMGGRSVDVRASAEYQAKAKELDRAETALTESKQDVDNRAKQVDEADGALTATAKERERYRELAKEFGALPGDDNPRIVVKAIGPAQSSYGYHLIPITIHNNTSATLTYYEIRYQLTDDAGNVVHAYFANGTATCAAKADCVIEGSDRFDPSGMTFTPISWNLDGSGDGTYGCYGTDVVTRRF